MDEQQIKVLKELVNDRKSLVTYHRQAIVYCNDEMFVAGTITVAYAVADIRHLKTYIYHGPTFMSLEQEQQLK